MYIINSITGFPANWIVKLESSGLDSSNIKTEGYFLRTTVIQPTRPTNYSGKVHAFIMDKLVLVIIFSTFVALSSSFPSQESDSLENEWIEKAIKTRREELADARENDMEDNELIARNKVLCPELGMLQHYDIDLKTSHIDCNPVARKRAANLFAKEFKKRELEFEIAQKARRSGACCSPDCDWLLDYLEIDSTVVKCLDRK
ncbi:uncharacterized protein LOC114959616 isoform X2 [Acropora millepora]|uniref:uncharacterized protein LOC114959616 isoform X2 n=1 Tax=Acropora millepora TaxID=45264 RepID=UPI001CF3FD0C|nr:uncharacterized protein LOC114959616 isoform X2 [Acropora millepora]